MLSKRVSPLSLLVSFQLVYSFFFYMTIIYWADIIMKVKVAESCLTLCDPMTCTTHGILQARILEWVAFPFSKGSSQPRGWTQVSCIASDSLPVEPPGKPKNTGVGSLSLLQRIFLTKELNQGHLHCRQIHIVIVSFNLKKF